MRKFHQLQPVSFKDFPLKISPKRPINIPMGSKLGLFIFSLSAFCVLALPTTAFADVEIFRQSLRELELSGMNRPKISQVYSKVRDELPRLAQSWMDPVVEKAKNEAVPGFESKLMKSSANQESIQMVLRSGSEEILLEIDLNSLEEPLKINGQVMPSAAWWSEKEFNEFLIKLPRKSASLSRASFFAQLFFGLPAHAESITAKAKEQACKGLPAPKVCSEANPEYLRRYQAARKSLELEMKQNPNLKLKVAPLPAIERTVASAPAVQNHSPSPARITAALVGMSLVWKSFYKNKSNSAESPVPMRLVGGITL